MTASNARLDRFVLLISFAATALLVTVAVGNSELRSPIRALVVGFGVAMMIAFSVQRQLLFDSSRRQQPRILRWEFFRLLVFVFLPVPVLLVSAGPVDSSRWELLLLTVFIVQSASIGLRVVGNLEDGHVWSRGILPLVVVALSAVAGEASAPALPVWVGPCLVMLSFLASFLLIRRTLRTQSAPG